MKLLILLPNVVLMAISGINLYNEFQIPNASLAVAILHIAVFVLCLTFVSLILKSMFTIKYTEGGNRQLKRINEPKVIRLQQTA